MAIVKKNILSILCGVVALIALVAVFFPIGGLFADNKKRLDEQVATHKKAESLLNESRTLPIVQPDRTEAEVLDRFPSPAVVESGGALIAALKTQSADVLKAAVARNRHEILMEGSLPEPASNVPALRFRNAYLQYMQTTMPEALGAGMPPTIDDIELKAEGIWKTKYAPNVYELNGQPANLQEVTDKFLDEAALLKPQMEKAAAERHRIYMDPGQLLQEPVIPGALSVSRAITPGATPTPADIWFAQQMLWVQQDVVAGINAANADSTSVLDSPVKHLISLRVPDGPEQYGMAAAPTRAPAGGEEEAAPAAAEGGPVPTDYTRSPTGRVSNPLYDPIHFTLVVRVDARQVPKVLAEMEKGRFITVLQMNAVSLNARDEMKDGGFVYGEAPIVELTLQCEALYMREWTVPLMPSQVKQMLGIQPPAEDEGAEAGGVAGTGY